VKASGLLTRLSEQYDMYNFEKKLTIYHEGKRPRFLYYLNKGKVKCVKMHEDGKEYITNLHNQGEFFGYTALIEDALYDDTAVVLEQAEVLQIPREEFLQMMYTDITIAAKFIHIITQNVKEKEERLLNLAYSSLRKRVAKALLDIVDKFDVAETGRPIEISREEIAQYIGTATESLNRTISDFKSEGLIDISKGKIVPVKIDKIRNLRY